MGQRLLACAGQRKSLSHVGGPAARHRVRPAAGVEQQNPAAVADQNGHDWQVDPAGILRPAAADDAFLLGIQCP